MVQVLNGKTVRNDADSYAANVGVWRTQVGNYNFIDDAGAQGVFTIFTVTGDVMVSVIGICQVLMDSGGAATIELGIAGNTAAVIAQTTATDLDQFETWQDAGPEANPGPVDVTARTFFVANGADIIMTVGAADLTAGDIDFLCRWFPVSVNGSVVKA